MLLKDTKIKKNLVLLLILLNILLVGGILFLLKHQIGIFISLITPFLLALVVAYILDPVVLWLEHKFKMKRTIAVTILVLFLILLIIILSLIVLPTLINEFYSAIKSIPRIYEKLIIIISNKAQSATAKKAVVSLKENIPKIQDYIPQIINHFNSITTQVYSKFKGFFGIFVDLGLFLIATFYFLKDFVKIKKFIYKLIPNRYKNETLQILSKIDLLLRNFFRGQLTVCTILAILNSIGLSVIQLKFSMFIGILSGYLNIIPYFGVSTGILISLIISYVQYGQFIQLFYVLLVFGIIQTLDGLFITPNIIGDKVGLSPIIIIFSLILAGSIAGIFGVLSAVPAACIVKVLFKHFIWSKIEKKDNID